MDDDYDRKKPKSGKTANDKMTLAAMTRMVQNKRAAKKSSVASDDSDYERNHRKKRKGKSPIPQTPPESVTKLSRKSATDTKSKSIPKAKTEKSTSKPKFKSEKKSVSNVNSKSSTDSGAKHTKTASKPAVPVADTQTKTQDKTPSKKNAKSMKIKAGDKTKNPKSKSKHAAAASVDVTTNIRPMSAKFKRKSGTKNMDKQTTTTGRPTSTKSSGKPKSRLQKSASIAHDLKIDASIWGALDDEKTADLSALALNSAARDAIKAAMNSTYFGHKIKINYRYRLDDNRIGVCRFFGIPLFAKTSVEWIGLVIEHNGVGEHDGTVQNKTYYRCREGKGLFVRPHRVIEDLGNQTRQLGKADIAGSAEMKQLIVDIKNGTDKRPSPVTAAAAATVTADAEAANTQAVLNKESGREYARSVQDVLDWAVSLPSGNHCSSAHCDYVQRIIEYLCFYQDIVRLADRNYALLLVHFDDKQKHSLLNDWNHVLLQHFGDQRTDNQSQQQFEEIYEQLTKILGICQLETCPAFRRNNRNREESEQTGFEDDELLSFYVDSLDAIHCFLLHSFDCNFRMRTSELIQEQYDEKTGDVGNQLLLNPKWQRCMDLATKARARLRAILPTDRVDHGKFITNVNEQQNTLLNDKNDEKHQHQDNKRCEYSFGFEFQGIPKYENLKTEILNNEIRRLSLQAFAKLEERAKEKAATEHARRLGSITREHLMAVMLYCTFTRLSYEFSRTFRKIRQDETYEEVKMRNCEFGHWSDLLNEAVNDYGDRFSDSKVRRFYHGINTKMVFTDFLFEFKCPTSLTATRSVAANFATNGGTGVILELRPAAAKTYFNCTWLSPFGNEDERLVMFAASLKIQTILCMQTGHDYRHFVHAFLWLNHCILGHDPPGTSSGGDKVIATKKDEKIIADMFQHFDHDREHGDQQAVETKFPDDYISQLFEAFADNTEEITVRVDQINQYYLWFYKILFTDYGLFHFSTVCKLFKKCSKITILYEWENDVDLYKLYQHLWVELEKTTQYIDYRARKLITITLGTVKCNEQVFAVLKKAPFIASLEKEDNSERTTVSISLKKSPPIQKQKLRLLRRCYTKHGRDTKCYHCL